MRPEAHTAAHRGFSEAVAPVRAGEVAPHEGREDAHAAMSLLPLPQVLGISPSESSTGEAAERYAERFALEMETVRRGIRDDGTLWVMAGDSYGMPEVPSGERIPYKAEEAALLPARLAISLQKRGWYLRNDIIVGSPVIERLRGTEDNLARSHEHILFLAKSQRYFFDSESVRERAAASGEVGTGRSRRDFWEPEGSDRSEISGYGLGGGGYKEALRVVVDASTPEKGVCARCGAPWRRVLEPGALDEGRPQARRAMELFRAGGLTEAHAEAIRAAGISDTGKSLSTTRGAGANSGDVMRLAAEARSVLGGYYREFLSGTRRASGWEPACNCRLSSSGEEASLAAARILIPFDREFLVQEIIHDMGRVPVSLEVRADPSATSRQ